MATKSLLKLDYLYDYFIKALPILLLELLAALAGTYYLRTNKNSEKNYKYLVYFLWYTFLNEVIGTYAQIAGFTKYEYFEFVENTVFEKNSWLYNIYFLLSISFYVIFFRGYLSSIKLRKTVLFILISYLIISVINFIFTDIFFTSYSVLAITIGTLLLLLTVILFYFNLLKTNKVFNLKNYLPFYISIGVLVFYLCVTPLLTFSKYFNKLNGMYVNLQANILLIANIFMYTTFIIGFLVCAKISKKDKELIDY